MDTINSSENVPAIDSFLNDLDLESFIFEQTASPNLAAIHQSG